MGTAAAIVASLSGLLGVVLGWMLRRKDREHQEAREDAYRWHEVRQRAYAAYVASVYQEFFRWTSFASAQDLRRHVEMVRQRGEEWMAAKADVDILATPDVLDAADGLADVLAEVVQRVADFHGKPRIRWRSASDVSEIEEARQLLIAGRKAFLRSVRVELGLTEESDNGGQ